MIGSSTILGLIRHELRLTFRAWFSRRPDGKLRGLPQMIITAVAVTAILVVGGIPLALLLRHARVSVSPLVAVIGAGSACALFTLMLSQTLMSSVVMFYDRGDLDLLLSSPASPTKVLTARTLSMAMSAVMIFALVLSPILLPVAVLGHPEWLAGYLVLFSIALAAAGAGLLLAILLMSTIGPRRTKTAAQLLAAVIGAALFILSQLQNIFGAHQAGSIWTRLAVRAQAGEIAIPAFASWPARAAIGEPGPLAIMVLAGVGLSAIAILIVGRRFAVNAALAKGAGDTARLRSSVATGVFRAGAFRALLVKDLRLMMRDPALISQVLLRVLYIAPLLFLVLGNAHGARNVGLAGAAAGLAFMAGQVTGSLSWITVSAEEAPELLAMSPTRPVTAWRAKLAASVLPVAALLAIPLAVLVYISPLEGLLTSLGCAGAAASSGLINIWMQKPSKRRDFRGRRDASLGATFAELGFCAIWAAAVGLAVSGRPLYGLAPAVIALGLLALLRQPEKVILRRIAEAAA